MQTQTRFLTPEQIERFKADGYLVVRGLYDPDEMQRISRWTDEVSAWPETPGRHMMYFETSSKDGARILNRLENFEPYHEGFSRLFAADKMLGAISDLFGQDAVLFKDKINFKMPGADGFAPHQDVQAGWHAYGSLHITAMISVDACTVENGCLEMVAGYQDKGLIGQSWAPLTDQDMAGMQFVPLETEPGDAAFFDSFAPHRSAPNTTDRARRVLYVTYNTASEGDQRRRYYEDKRKSYPPDCEREPGKEYVFRV